MRKLVLLMSLVAAVLLTAGCTEQFLGNATSSNSGSGDSNVVKITQLEQINTSLQKGPVLLKMGSRWCPHCRSMKPVLERLAVENGKNATIASIDVDQNPELAEYFGVGVIPDSCVITGIENGTYVYMQEDGNISTDRAKARMVGFNSTDANNDDEKRLEKVLKFALLR
ncbi:MAG: thioredoxin domain-containing protein [Syntrophothermus sp.]